MTPRIILLLLFTIAPLALPVHAALIVLSNGLVNDTDQNITWIQDASLVASSCRRNDALWQAFNPPTPGQPIATFTKTQICRNGGSMSFEQAQYWIAALNAVNYLGYSDWRLPQAVLPDPSCDSPADAQGYNCTGSELGYLFNTSLGNPNAGSHNCGHLSYPSCLQNTGPFQNMPSVAIHMQSASVPYWFNLTYGNQWLPSTPPRDSGNPTVHGSPGLPIGYTPLPEPLPMAVRDGLSAVIAAAPSPGPQLTLLPRPRGTGPGLVDLGNGLIADTSQNITWLKDANMVKTSCDNNDALWQAFTPQVSMAELSISKQGVCDAGGSLISTDISDWINLMNTHNYLGYNDWRLPSRASYDETCSALFILNTISYDRFRSEGYGCLQTEMGRLWYTLAPHGLGNLSQLDDGCTATDCMLSSGPYINLTGGQFNASYQRLDLAGAFWFSRGYYSSGLIWPVRPGLSGLQAVPEEIPVYNPIAMFISALSLLALACLGLRRRQPA